MDADEEVVGGRGGREYSGGEDKTGWVVAAGDVGLGFHGLEEDAMVEDANEPIAAAASDLRLTWLETLMTSEHIAG
jgi:hypothetical protein